MKFLSGFNDFLARVDFLNNGESVMEDFYRIDVLCKLGIRKKKYVDSVEKNYRACFTYYVGECTKKLQQRDTTNEDANDFEKKNNAFGF